MIAIATPSVRETMAMRLTHFGDGALGFWNAQRDVFGAPNEQRCWSHETGNVPHAMPNPIQVKAKGRLHDIH